MLVERCSRSGLGTVIVNLQQTRLDGAASLRIFSQSDRLMKLLTERLQLRYSPPKVRRNTSVQVLALPRTS